MPTPVPVLSVVDSGDGVNAVATISGTVMFAATNTLYIQRFGVIPWTLAGVLAGDGNIPLALTKGSYWAVVRTEVAGAIVAVSNVTRFHITTGDDSTHLRLATSIQESIVALDLFGSKGTHLHALPDENAVLMPCVVVWFNDAEQVLGGTNRRDRIGFPVHVSVMNRKLTGMATPPAWAIAWRERISDRFRNQRISGVPTSEISEIQFNKVIDEQLPMYLYLVSSLTVLCWCNQPRG